MKHVAISLGASSPLAIRADHAPGGMVTASYISGSTFLGSLAAAHRMVRAERTQEFEQLFLSGEILYSNLYPAAFKKQWMENTANPVYPVPLTAQSCKRHKGFLPLNPEDEDDEHHGVRDTLFDWAIYKKMEASNFSSTSPKVLQQRLQVLQQYKECSTCKAAMDHFDGYYRRESIEPYRPHSAVIDSHKRLRTHTGINRGLGSVQEGILYNRQVFEEDMRFWGEVRLPDNKQVADAFSTFMDEVGSGGWVRIGAGRSRGMGKVTISAEEMEQDENPFAAFKTRLQRFNQELQRHMKEQVDHGAAIEPDPFYFAITLHSPLILCDDRLRYYGTLDGNTVMQLANISSPSFTLLYQAASTRRVMGWNELWGMPREHEYATDTGSVFLYTCTEIPGDSILRALYQIEEQGIGRRKAEGFGRILFSDPFHLEVNLR